MSLTRRSLREPMPTLTDPSEASSRENTEPAVSSSVWPPFAEAPLPHPIAAHLETIRSPDASCSHPLTTIRTTIGRGADADLIVNDSKVSRSHARIFYTGTEFRIRDESSINGTRLNGSRVVEYTLRHNDEIAIGDTVFRFCVRL